MTALPEKSLNLWMLIASPLIWAVHFIVAYATAAIWCAKTGDPDVSLAPARTAILVYTAVALVAIALIGWRGWRHHRHGGGDLPHDDDTPEDRHRFLGFATVLLSALSAIATIYEAMTLIFVGSCR